MKIETRQSTPLYLAKTPEHSVADQEEIPQQEIEWQIENPQEQSRSSEQGLLDDVALKYSGNDFEIIGKCTTSPRHEFPHLEYTLTALGCKQMSSFITQEGKVQDMTSIHETGK